MYNTHESRENTLASFQMAARLDPKHSFHDDDKGGIRLCIFAPIKAAEGIRALYPECIDWKLIEAHDYNKARGTFPDGRTLVIEYIYKTVPAVMPAPVESEWVLAEAEAEMAPCG